MTCYCRTQWRNVINVKHWTNCINYADSHHRGQLFAKNPCFIQIKLLSSSSRAPNILVNDWLQTCFNTTWTASNVYLQRRKATLKYTVFTLITLFWPLLWWNILMFILVFFNCFSTRSYYYWHWFSDRVKALEK